MPSFTHRVRLHFTSISLTAVPFNTHLAKAQEVYSQYGIKIEYGSGILLGLSPEEAARFEKVDGQCAWNIDSGEYHEIQNLGSSTSSTDISVYYVNRFSSGGLGCGGHLRGRPACIVASAGSK